METLIKNPKYDSVKLLSFFALIILVGGFLYMIGSHRRSGLNQAQVFDSVSTIGDYQLQALPGIGFDTVASTLEIETPAFYQMIQDSGAHVLRQPGEDVNYWHYTGHGLGVLSSETTRDGVEAAHRGAAAWTNQYSFSFFDKFNSVIRNSASKTIVSLNVVSQIDPTLPATMSLSDKRKASSSIQLAINENLALLANLKSQGITVLGAQIGAENYLSGNGTFPTAQDFITRVTPIVNAIHTAYPTLPIIFDWSPPDKLTAQRAPWNTAFQQNASLSTGAQLYTDISEVPSVIGCTQTDITALFACMNTYSKNLVDHGIPDRTNALKAMAPGKYIYQGLWNVNAPDVGIPDSYANTDLQMLDRAEIMMSLAKYNANNSNIIKNASFMNLGGGGATRNLISKIDTASDDAGNVVNNGTGTGAFVERAAFHGLAITKGVFDGTHKLMNLTYAAPSTVPADDFRLYGFKGSNDATLIIINRSGASIPLGNITLAGHPIQYNGSFNVQADYGSALSSTYGKKSHNGTFTPIVLSGPQTYTTTSDITIHPYSVTKIVISSATSVVVTPPVTRNNTFTNNNTSSGSGTGSDTVGDQPLGTLTPDGVPCSATDSHLSGTTCMHFLVNTPTLPAIGGKLWITSPGPNPVATLITTSGADGSGFAYDGVPFMQDLVSANYQVVQLTWDTGWRDEDMGPLHSAGRYATVLKYVNDHYAGTSAMCATGNSNGAMQIGYAIGRYGAGSFLKAAVMTSGPWAGRLDLGCGSDPNWATQSRALYDAAGGAGTCVGTLQTKFGPGITSGLNNAFGDVNACKDAATDSSLAATLLSESALNTTSPVAFPKTWLSFFYGAEDCGSTVAGGLAFANQVSSAKQIQVLANTGHASFSGAEGGAAVKGAILAHCHN